MVKAYPAVFHYEENGYWVEFPDLPGCLSEGEDAAQALAQASSALGGYLCSLLDRGMELPQPGRIQSLHADGNDDFVSMVAADPLAFKQRTKAVKKTLTIPQWLNDEAEKRHINFSSVLQQALIAQIQ
ncbi:MAG: type II toxin-antitoxin system HicB family antitoxin [Clostridia bacterium]|nr:type II toxin-antitoxin system HicB family antitoxin [Clostridia bacterium]